jgi:hypothetical protein
MTPVTTEARTAWERTSDIQYRIASTRKDREVAFRLVYYSYLQAGLGEENSYRMRVTPYHILDSTEVFIAECRGQVAFTMSLIRDGALGLPMETVYADEVNRLRQRGLRLGEVSCLADRRADVHGFFPLFVRTGRMMVQFARYCGLDALLVAVHPKHARFYRRYMDFHAFGSEKTYPTVRNNPAVALWLEFARIDAGPSDRYNGRYEVFFGEQIPIEHLQPQPISPADREYFMPMIDRNFVCAPLGDMSEYEPAFGGDCPLTYVV